MNVVLPILGSVGSKGHARGRHFSATELSCLHHYCTSAGVEKIRKVILPFGDHCCYVYMLYVCLWEVQFIECVVVNFPHRNQIVGGGHTHTHTGHNHHMKVFQS